MRGLLIRDGREEEREGKEIGEPQATVEQGPLRALLSRLLGFAYSVPYPKIKTYTTFKFAHFLLPFCRLMSTLTNWR